MTREESKLILERLEKVEEFQDRIRLGQKWFLCILACIGTAIAVAYQIVGILSSPLIRHAP